MSILKTLNELELANNSVLFHKGTRDNSNIDVYRDLNSGVIFIKDHFIGEDEYRSGEYKKEVSKKADKDLIIKNFERENDCARRVKENFPFYIAKDIADFGCGEGDFLKETKKLTKSSVGIELQIECIKNLNNIGIRCENSLDILEKNSIDTFFLFHSFEHLPEPLKILKEIKSKLRKKGRLIIEVPHANDFLISTIKDENFIKFTLWSQHLILHTKNSLNKFLDYAGFQNILIKGIQRYPLSNHLHWIINKKPGGHQSQFAFIDTNDLTKAYEQTLANLDSTDTLLAIAEIN